MTKLRYYIYIEREFQHMTSTFDNCILYYQTKILIDFLCRQSIELKISYSTIRDFLDLANYNSQI